MNKRGRESEERDCKAGKKGREQRKREDLTQTGGGGGSNIQNDEVSEKDGERQHNGMLWDLEGFRKMSFKKGNGLGKAKDKEKYKHRKHRQVEYIEYNEVRAEQEVDKQKYENVNAYNDIGQQRDKSCL